jgi:hypothetical protein
MPPDQLCRNIAAGVGLVLLSMFAGCRDGRQATYPVSGQVTIGGKPAAGADLRFYETRGRTPGLSRPYATTDAEGCFVVSTYGMHDGAPPGEYRVAVSWKGPLDSISPDQRDAMPERLPARFADPSTSGIQVRIVRGQNLLETIQIVP